MIINQPKIQKRNESSSDVVEYAVQTELSQTCLGV